MDVKQYYRKIREIEGNLSEPYVLVTSLETADGGRAGMVSEVSRHTAAKMIAEARAVLANESEKQAYFEGQEAVKKAAQKAELARRVQVAIIADSNLDTPATGKRSSDPGSGRKS